MHPNSEKPSGNGQITNLFLLRDSLQADLAIVDGNLGQWEK